jgi:two-component system, OmpR family, response regulator
VTSAPHIMVVDDDHEIRTLLCDFLNNNGYQGHALADGQALDRAMQRQRADLIVLDLMLPGEDGFAICRRLRQRSNVPIIMLTARDEDIDQIVGFEVGADDYVRKPFNPRALLARIRAVLRRAEPSTYPAALKAQRFQFAGCQLHTVSRSLQRADGQAVDLNGAEYELLVLLLADPQRVWSRLELSQQIHGRDNDPFDRSIDVRISRLRQKLGDTARAPSIIKTVYGGGYFMGVSVTCE